MALSDEWEEVHLTPKGWVDGSYMHDHGHTQSREVPPDTVLTAYRRVFVAAIGARPNVTMEETVRTTDEALIKRLLEKFGPPVFGV